MMINNVKIEDGQQGVYLVTVKADKTDYVYVGSGNLYTRCSQNKGKLEKGKHDNKTLQEAYNSSENVKIFAEVLEYCDTELEARELENDYIDYYKKVAESCGDTIVCNKNKASLVVNQYQRRLTRDDVKEMKRLFETDLNNKKIAKMYGCSCTHVANIRSGKKWASVK